MKKVSFYGAFADGLVQMSGHEFEMAGHKFAVHKGREPFDLEYRVSEIATGFSVPIDKTEDMQRAVELAKDVIASLPEGVLEKALRSAAARRATLQVIDK